MKNLALGLQSNPPFGSKRILFSCDDSSSLITDGVMKAKNPDRAEFVLNRLGDSFKILGMGKNYFNTMINKRITKPITVKI